MNGKIVITVSTADDGSMSTSIDMDVQDVAAIEAVATVCNLAQALEIPPHLLLPAIELYRDLQVPSTHVAINRGAIEKGMAGK